MILSNVEDFHLYPKVSNSELYTINRCKKMWEYQYLQGLTPSSTPTYLSDGSFLHALMAEMYRNPDSIDTISKRVQGVNIQEGVPSVSEETRTRFVEQLEAYFGEFPLETVEVVAVEQEFYANIGITDVYGSPVLVHGIVDAVVRADDGQLWLVEHKTASRAWSVQQFEFATQDVLYCIAWEALTGERPAGVQYNFFYPKRWEIKYKFAGPEQDAAVLADVQASVSLRDTIAAYPREPLYGCGGCRFRDLCYTELVGGDSQYLRDTQYTVDQDRVDRFTEGE